MQKIICNLIRQNGFIKLDDFIFQAMCHPEYGYYSKNNPLKKDFITSPEITNAFGILVASKIVDKLLSINFEEFEQINICEFGGGTGKLAFDILNFILNLGKLNNKKINNLIKKINYNSVEFSEKLTKIQKNNLGNINVHKYFFKNIDEFLENQNNDVKNKKNITIFLSNEFFDALPIKQFIVNKNEFSEIIIINENNKLIYSKISINKNNILNNYFNIENIPQNSIVEFPIFGINILENIINFVKKNKSMFITFDYGFLENNYRNTLQGIYQNKKQKNILENIGDADITHLVNFELFGEIVKNNGLIPEIKTQREFLLENGIGNLINDKNKDGISRILEKNQMGDLFKVLWFENL